MGHLPARAQQAQPQSDADAVEAPEIVAEKAAQRRAAALLRWALADDAWLHSTRVEVALQRPLLRLATHYLLKERRRWGRGGSRRRCREPCVCLPASHAPACLRMDAACRVLALDPVANFHLRNGAAVLQLNWRADTSDAGLARSHGIMVRPEWGRGLGWGRRRWRCQRVSAASLPATQTLLLTLVSILNKCRSTTSTSWTAWQTTIAPTSWMGQSPLRRRCGRCWARARRRYHHAAQLLPIFALNL